MFSRLLNHEEPLGLVIFWRRKGRKTVDLRKPRHIIQLVREISNTWSI